MARGSRFSHISAKVFILFGLVSLSACVMLESDIAIDEYFQPPFVNITYIQQSLIAAGSRSPELVQVLHAMRKTPAFYQARNQSATPLHSPGLKDFLNNQCRKDITYILLSLKQPWAQQLIDAFGKPESGLLVGTFRWVGDYDECLKVSAPPHGSLSKGFRGRYAWLTLDMQTAATPLGSIAIGACLPSSCAEDNNFVDLESSILSLLDKIPFVRKIVPKIPYVKAAFVPEKNPLSGGAIACICICAIFGALVMLGTLVDIHHRVSASKVKCGNPDPECTVPKSLETDTPDNGNFSKDDVQLVVEDEKTKPPKTCPGQEFLLCFSAISNAEAIFDTSSGKEQMQCLHGMRFLSMAWVILGHTYVFGATEFGNLLDVVNVFDTWPFQIIKEATYSVDTFFVLSGFLLTYLFLKTEHQFKGAKQWINFYVHRYVRLTPVYVMIIFIFATWWNNMSNGPFWTMENGPKCHKYWWWNILYINNFAGVNDGCIGWSWYLANDMQFFVISPIFLLALKRDRIVGLVVVAVLLVASWITTGVISSLNSYGVMFEGLADSSNVQESQEKQWKLFDAVYDKPYTRIGPYLIGVFLAYAINELKGTKITMSRWTVILGWVGSQLLSLSLLYGLYKANLGPATSSAHNALARSAWGLYVAWIIFACLTGHAGPVNTVLSWKGWIPMSRLTYCAYLVHPMVMYWYYNSLKTTLYFHNSLIVIHYLAFVVLAYGVAFIASLFFEAPIMKLEKLLKRK